MADSKINVDVDDFLESLGDYQQETANKLKTALKTCALSIEGDAKKSCPVDTGRLRSSITTDLSQINSYEASVGTNVEYAPHVEYGTSKQSAKPYLRPAFNKNVAKLEKSVKDILGGK